MKDYPFPWRWNSEKYSEAYRNCGIPESKIQQAALAILRARGCLAWAVDAGAKQLRGRAVAALRASGGSVASLVGRTGVAERGFSDIVGIQRRDGRAIFIEVKAPGKNPTQEQLDFLHAVFQAGAIAGVVWAGLDVIPILRQGETDED